MGKINTILVANDFSENSEHAFQYALAIAKRMSARLIIIHVIHEAFDLRGFYVPHISFDKLDKEVEGSAREMMENFCRKQVKDFDKVETAVVFGVPHIEIMKKAEEEKASMIVMGTQGLTGVAHMLFGSTAEKVVKNAKCPVLVVPLP